MGSSSATAEEQNAPRPRTAAARARLRMDTPNAGASEILRAFAPRCGGERMPRVSVDTMVSSFSKALMLGEIHEELVFPYPKPDADEAEKVRKLIAGFRAYADANIDP